MLSVFVPRRLRDDFAALYAFCRVADDLADEQGRGPEARARALKGLGAWRADLHRCAAGEAEHPVYLALRATIRRRRLPIHLFERLLDAFEQDQRVDRYATWGDLLGYCRNSADPVGRLVLGLFGVLDEAPASALRQSDAVCTALQLTNFWQDIRRDLEDRDRVYLPLPEMGLDEQTLRAWMAAPPTPQIHAAAAEALAPLIVRTRSLFDEGAPLAASLPREARRVVWLFSAGGRRVLDRVERARGGTLWRRPRLTKTDRFMLLARAVLCVQGGAGARGHAGGAGP